MAFATRAVRQFKSNAAARLALGGASCSSWRPFSASTARLQQQSQPQTQKKEWLVIVPDYPGALQTRLNVRPKHLTDLKPAVDDGFWVMGGATLDVQPSEDGNPPQINGSIMVAVANSREEVLERLKSDVYNSAGVWDLSRVEIRAFRSAIRKEL